ncbi:MAG: glycosyltransferase family 2 protein [Deltaproteobacteria bacterium]|nr:glycosyltransferase family 2 protein [Deltaproteobacteria bacterium]MBW2083312.1 glycosyltransferase family 2 protein [Deltaproteobacteria bacterium]HDM10888.1 glycosyltransferase family 2 protein [Desulfobacteraceae bacterium]
MSDQEISSIGNPDLSVVVPVHNESENIAPLISEIRDALDGKLNYEVVYVDDGSTDDTLEILRSIAGQFSRLRIIRHQECFGQSAAIWTGIKEARGRWIATLDGDGQNDPKDILKIIESTGGLERLDPNVVLCGFRKKRRDTWVKRASSRIANGIRKALLKDNTLDTGCGLKVFAREAYMSLPFFDHMHRFLPALFLSKGARVESVEVNHRPRHKGVTHYGIRNRLWVGIIDLLGVMWLRRRMKNPEAREEKI